MKFLDWMRAREAAMSPASMDKDGDIAIHQPHKYNDIPEGGGSYFEEFFPLDVRETFEGEDRLPELDRYEPRGRKEEVLRPEVYPLSEDEGAEYSEHADYVNSLRDLQRHRPSSVLDASENDRGQNPDSVRRPNGLREADARNRSVRVRAGQVLQASIMFMNGADHER